MKRSSLLLSVLLFVALAAVGYPNSHVTKETPTYQEVVKVTPLSDQAVVAFTSVDAERAMDVVVDAPWLGNSNTAFVRRAAKDSNGYSSELRKPPRCRCQKLGLSNKEFSIGL